MKILGIETSCDETAAAVVENGQRIQSNVVVSSLKDHQKYGGVIPEIASRRQMESINAVVKKALSDANLKLKDIDAIAVTRSPGLIGSLLVGISFARALSYATKKPLIYVDHIKAHLYANFLYAANEKNKELPKLPAIGLVVSGGHTSLYHLSAALNFKLLGHTLDDAVGEAFDKVAKVLGLAYPGGPIIDRLSKTVQSTSLDFKCAELPNTFNFSFSGIKTAVLYHKQKHKRIKKNEVAYAFQKSVVSILVKKCLAACKKKRIKTLVVGGGVAANSMLRTSLIEEGQKEGIIAYFPAMSLCLDNAAMIAGLGYQNFKKANHRAQTLVGK